MTPNRVVLPAPLRPTRPTRAPVGMRAEAPSKSLRPAMRTVRSSMTSMPRLLTDGATRSNPRADPRCGRQSGGLTKVEHEIEPAGGAVAGVRDPHQQCALKEAIAPVLRLVGKIKLRGEKAAARDLDLDVI